MVQHCPPSCAHPRPQLVEVVNVLLAHVTCEQTKLVENLLRPLWMKSFLRTFQKDQCHLQEKPKFQRSCKGLTSLIMFFTTVAQCWERLACYPTRKHMCIWRFAVNGKNSARGFHVSFNHRNWSLSPKPVTEIKIEIIVAHGLHSTFMESLAHGTNTCTCFNVCQTVCDVRVQTLEEHWLFCWFDPYLSSNDSLLEIQHDGWSFGWVNVHGCEKGNMADCRLTHCGPWNFVGYFAHQRHCCSFNGANDICFQLQIHCSNDGGKLLRGENKTLSQSPHPKHQ